MKDSLSLIVCVSFQISDNGNEFDNKRSANSWECERMLEIVLALRKEG